MSAVLIGAGIALLWVVPVAGVLLLAAGGLGLAGAGEAALVEPPGGTAPGGPEERGADQ